MNRFKFKYRVALLMLGFSLFYTQAADKDALGKKPNTHINTAAGITDEYVNEKQISKYLLLLLPSACSEKKRSIASLDTRPRPLIL